MAGAQEHQHGFTVACVLCSVQVMFPGACPCALRTGGRRGVAARAGRMGSGGRPGRTWHHAGAGPVAVAGGRGRSSRRSAVALSVLHSGVGGRAGGGRVLQAMLRRARAQGRRRARCGPLCGPRDLR